VTLRGSALIAVAAGAAALITGATYGAKAGAETLLILLGLGATTMLVARGLLGARRRLGGLRRQVAISGALIAGQLVAAAALFAWLMLVSSMDVLFTVVAVLFSCVLGAWVARTLGARVMSDVDAVRAALTAIEAGARKVSVETSAQDEVAELGRHVERMAAALDAEEQARLASDTARRDLLAAVSHDLRTPLTSIRVLAEAIEDAVVDDATSREYAGRLAVHARSFSALIDDLFELSRLEAGEIRWTMQQVQIAELVEETVDAMRPQADAGAVALQLDLPRTRPRAQANPERIQRVLFNLLQNAIRHTPADGSVTVRAEPVGDAVEIEVADTGEGIDPRERASIFEPFVQGAAQASRTNGQAGLGLAIARAIVEAHGGRIWLADGSRGTRVRFSLPAA
jgi:signal transduction histidine kinase